MKQAITPFFAAAVLAVLTAESVSAMEKPAVGGGVIMGYTLGQNGRAWPSPLTNPLQNENRGGFYISQTRLRASLQFDTTFVGFIQGNVMGAEVLEAYLQKDWGDWRFKGGKFRGAGLKSGSGTDEFNVTSINRPRYTRVWNFYKKLQNYSDFGVQVERPLFDGRMQNRFFLHNGNGENVFNDEPSYPAGPATQALGLDYAFDVAVGGNSSVGGHVGALANVEWDEFVGTHAGWEAQYWFKSNPLLDMSLNQQMRYSNFKMENEILVMWNRTLPDADGSAMVSWGLSTLARFDRFRRWSPYLGYEFFDHSDGRYHDDALHMFRVGTFFIPAPQGLANLRVTAQYLRALEEGLENIVSNDGLYAQLQMVF